MNPKVSKLAEKNRSDITVRLVSNQETHQIMRVQALQPKALRSGVESVLRIDKGYKTLQQVDLSTFSQMQQEQDLYWNLVFWFKYMQLPYLWMAPYLSHLEGPVDINSGASNNQAPEMVKSFGSVKEMFTYHFDVNLDDEEIGQSFNPQDIEINEDDILQNNQKKALEIKRMKKKRRLENQLKK